MLEKDGASIRTGDILVSNNNNHRVIVVKIDENTIKLRWEEEIGKIKGACYNLTQEFDVKIDEFLQSAWTKRST